MPRQVGRAAGTPGRVGRTLEMPRQVGRAAETPGRVGRTVETPSRYESRKELSLRGSGMPRDSAPGEQLLTNGVKEPDPASEEMPGHSGKAGSHGVRLLCNGVGELSPFTTSKGASSLKGESSEHTKETESSGKLSGRVAEDGKSTNSPVANEVSGNNEGTCTCKVALDTLLYGYVL
jgi:hypothetical protein